MSENARHDDQPLPDVVPKPDEARLQHLITSLRSMEQQVGAHIIAALGQDDTVAVLTTVVNGPDGEQLVSAALDQDTLQEVRLMIAHAEAQRYEEVPCLGFHCFLKPKEGTGEAGEGNGQ